MLKRTDLAADPRPPLEDSAIGDVVGRILDDAKAYAKAEATLVRAQVEAKANRYRKAAILAVAGTLTAFAALVALCLTLVMAISSVLGPLAGGLVATLIIGSAAVGLLLWAKAEASND